MLLKKGLTKLGLVVAFVLAISLGALVLHSTAGIVYADDGGTVAGVTVPGDTGGGHGAAIAIGGSLALGGVIAKGIDLVRSQFLDDGGAGLSRRQNLALVFAVTATIVLFAAFAAHTYDPVLIILTIAQQGVTAIGLYGAGSAAKAGGVALKPSA